MSVPDTTVSVPLAALPEARAAAAPGAPAIADDAVQLDNAAFADRVVFLADGKVVGELASPTADSVLEHMKELGT